MVFEDNNAKGNCRVYFLSFRILKLGTKLRISLTSAPFSLHLLQHLLPEVVRERLALILRWEVHRRPGVDEGPEALETGQRLAHLLHHLAARLGHPMEDQDAAGGGGAVSGGRGGVACRVVALRSGGRSEGENMGFFARE